MIVRIIYFSIIEMITVTDWSNSEQVSVLLNVTSKLDLVYYTHFKCHIKILFQDLNAKLKILNSNSFKKEPDLLPKRWTLK